MVFSPFGQKMVVGASILAKEKPDRFCKRLTVDDALVTKKRNQGMVGYVFQNFKMGWLRLDYVLT
jgi:hypothetical protein